jgi:hypothetical protein
MHLPFAGGTHREKSVGLLGFRHHRQIHDRLQFLFARLAQAYRSGE